LVGVGWWTEEGDAYVIRHHATYQRTREQVLQQQEVNRQNGGKGGRPAKPKRPSKTDPVSESESDSVSEPQTAIETEPDRTGLAIRAGTGEAVDGAASLLPMRPGETDEEYESRFDEWEAARAMGGEADVDEYDQAFSAKAG
jgi:hypothetical protein